MLDHEQKSIVRQAVRRYLAERPVAAFTAPAITGFLMGRQYVDFPIGVGDVADALTLLAGMNPPQVKKVFASKLATVENWQITSDGTLAHERGE
jgi:hypothetical protein